MTQKPWANIEDFATLFQYCWYRDFPIDNKGSKGAKRADWTIHIGIVVRQVGDLLGFVTRFEHGGRKDAILRSTEGDEVAIEWEWEVSHGNETEKLRKHKVWSKVPSLNRSLKYAVFITYLDVTKENKEEISRTIKDDWSATYPLLLILIEAASSDDLSSKRKFKRFNMFRIENDKIDELRSAPAVPWNVPTTQWSQE